MSRVKPLYDKEGVIRQAEKELPDDLHKIQFLEALAELADNECYSTWKFPKTQLHKVTGIKQAVYRAYIDKISGWRLHVQLINAETHLIDIISGDRHDEVQKVIKAKKKRYR